MRALAAVSLAAAVACSGDGPTETPTVAAVFVDATTTRLEVGQTAQFSATAIDAAGNAMAGVAISWRSSDAAVASVTPSGRVTARTEGTAYISASAGDHSSGVDVTVITTSSGAPAIALSPPSVSFTATTGAATPAPRTVSVTNGGAGTLSGLAVGNISYGAGQATGWLSASLDRATAPASLTVQPSTAGLAAGAYTATIPVSAASATNSPQSVTVTLTVTAAPSTAYRGTLTLARGAASAVFEEPEEIVDFDLASAAFTVRFNGVDPHRLRSGETAFLARLAAGAVANRGVVVADARGVTGAPLYICRDFSWLSNRICHTPRLSPNTQLVAFGTAGDGGSVCQDSYGLYWANYVVVLDRNGAEVARFEGYYMPEWLPDGRLLMMGSACRGAGVWIADASLRTLTRVDGNQVGTPGGQPAVSPNGSRVIFVWNQQLWMLTLDGRSELTQLTAFQYSVTSATWSPDGSAVALLAADESLPIKAVILFRPGDRQAVTVSVPFFPFGPISWQ